MKSCVVSFEEIQKAAHALKGQIVETPCCRSQVLSQMTGAEVWLKFENFQFTASFKERGALTKLLSLTPEQRSAGVAAVSAGNHAQGVAYHARRLGIAATIVMPRHTPLTKVRNTRELGAEVILRGETLSEAMDFMREELIRKRGMTLVHPFDDPVLIAGQGTLALEMLQVAPHLSMLAVPVGGGGLISGCAIAAHGANPAVEIIGVESVGYACGWAALHGEKGGILGGQTIAEGIAVAEIGALPLQIMREHVSEILRVKEPLIERAISLLATIEKVVVEGAGAVGLAALLSEPARFKGRSVGVVLSGGNIDPRLLASVLMRQLVQESRLVKVHIDIEDKPGFLGRVATLIGDRGGNIVEVHHDRLRAATHAKSADLEMLIEVETPEHAEVIIRDLRAIGLAVRVERPNGESASD